MLEELFSLSARLDNDVTETNDTVVLPGKLIARFSVSVGALKYSKCRLRHRLERAPTRNNFHNFLTCNAGFLSFPKLNVSTNFL